MSDTDSNNLTPALLINAYAQGVFPMSDDENDPDVYWVRPQRRGIIPLDGFHVPKSLKKHMRKNPFEIAIDRDFEGVISGCAESKPGRETTWINHPIRKAYGELFKLGYCHTVEAWQENKLVGGLYGLALGQAFFGESMFSRATDASKICLVALVDHLKSHHFTLLDTQFVTPHLEHFGAIEISRRDYEQRLQAATQKPASF